MKLKVLIIGLILAGASACPTYADVNLDKADQVEAKV
jgi:hypothetical protein